MGAITYTAKDRAPLMTSVSPVHVAETQYQFEVKFQAFSTNIDQPKTQHVSIGGAVETVLKRATDMHMITIIWPHEENEQLQEFIYSIAGGETFTIDPYGTIATPDDPIDVLSIDAQVSINRMQHGKEHWRSVSFNLRKAV